MQTLSKTERLSSRVAIDNLFNSGNSFYSKPFEIYFLETKDSLAPAQVVISVPKRLYKRAVDRNRVKRLFREVYRKNKAYLYQEIAPKQFHIMFIYKSKKIISYAELEDVFPLVLKKLIEKVNV